MLPVVSELLEVLQKSFYSLVLFYPVENKGPLNELAFKGTAEREGIRTFRKLTCCLCFGQVREDMLFEALTTRKTVTVGEKLIVPYKLAEVRLQLLLHFFQTPNRNRCFAVFRDDLGVELHTNSSVLSLIRQTQSLPFLLIFFIFMCFYVDHKSFA